MSQNVNKQNGMLLKGFRLQNDITLDSLANIVGKSRSQVVRYENGYAPIPKEIVNRLNREYKLGLKITKKSIKTKSKVCELDVILNKIKDIKEDLNKLESSIKKLER